MSTRYPILSDLATRPYDTCRECREVLTEIDSLRDAMRQYRREHDQLAAQIEVLETVITRLRCICDAAFSVVRDDGAEDGWTTWQELLSALEDARYEPRGVRAEVKQ